LKYLSSYLYIIVFVCQLSWYTSDNMVSIRKLTLSIAASTLICFPVAAETLTQTVQVSAVIEPEMTLSIEPATGSSLDLGTIRGSVTQARLSDPVNVVVRISTNMNQPYRVTQALAAPLANEEGDTLPPESLHFVTGAVEGDVTSGSQTVFSSTQGSSAEHVVTYQLEVPADQPGGTYHGAFMMTVVPE
jgi:hypothetical protein